MASRQSNRPPQRRPQIKARPAPAGRAGSRPARIAPIHRNHTKRGRR